MEDSEGYSVAEPVNPDSERYQEIQDGFVDIDGGFTGSGGGEIPDDATGEDHSFGSDISSDVGEHDIGRSAADGDATTADGEQDAGNAGSDGTSEESGQQEPLDVQITGQPISVEVESFESFEGVTAEDFEDYSEMVQARLDAMDAMMIVLMVAIFLCAGISAVDTLVRRMERG